MNKLIVNPYFRWSIFSVFGYFVFGFFQDDIFGLPRFSLLIIWGFFSIFVFPKFLTWGKNIVNNYILIAVFEAFVLSIFLFNIALIGYKVFQPALKIAFAVFLIYIIYKIVLRFIKDKSSEVPNDM